MKARMNKQETDWMAESDADTLARAAEIKADKKRLSAASKAAAKMHKDAAVRAKAMKSIAKKSMPKKSSKPMKKGK